MRIDLQRRAEIALRSLSTRDRALVEAALDRLQATGFQTLLQHGQLKQLHQAFGSGLYVLRATRQLRIIVSRRDDLLIIEDIIPHDRLARLRRYGR